MDEEGYCVYLGHTVCGGEEDVGPPEREACPTEMSVLDYSALVGEKRHPGLGVDAVTSKPAADNGLI